MLKENIKSVTWPVNDAICKGKIISFSKFKVHQIFIAKILQFYSQNKLFPQRWNFVFRIIWLTYKEVVYHGMNIAYLFDWFTSNLIIKIIHVGTEK